MAEENDGQERSEEASSRKKDKAREEGQAVRSRELNTMSLVIAGAVAVWFLAPASARLLADATRQIFELVSSPETGMFEALELGLSAMIWSILPLLILMMFAGLVSSMAIGGLVFSSKAIAFKASRMSPLSGLKRMFSAKSLIELVKSIAKFVLVTGVSIGVMWAVLAEIMALSQLPMEAALSSGSRIVGLSLLLIGCSLAVVAAIDVPYEIWSFNKQQRMTKQEVRDEMKDSEGKPEVKSRIRQLQQEISRRRMLADVPEADVIITNPEHFAVAVKYDSARNGAPKVLAKGVDELAMRIREVGRAHKVVQVQSPPLARALFYTVQVGGEVPQALYVAVAQVLAYVYQLKSYRAGAVPEVPVYREANIPEEFRKDATGASLTNEVQGESR
jgi:flagellar biosynthetic protein FlhB